MDLEGLLLRDSPRMEPKLPEGLDLQTFQTVQQCTAGLPHSCEGYWSASSEEEREQLVKWFDECVAQLRGKRLRPDIEREKVSASWRPVSSPPACLHAAQQEDQD